jgi:hypothetical protein
VWGECNKEEGVCNTDDIESQSCPSGTGSQKRTCNASCQWDDWTTVECIEKTCDDYSYRQSHKSECCPKISFDNDDIGCYNREWVHPGQQAMGFGSVCGNPPIGMPQCNTVGGTYDCVLENGGKGDENGEAFIPCDSNGKQCFCMICTKAAGDKYNTNEIIYTCSVTKNGW